MRVTETMGTCCFRMGTLYMQNDGSIYFVSSVACAGSATSVSGVSGVFDFFGDEGGSGVTTSVAFAASAVSFRCLSSRTVAIAFSISCRFFFCFASHPSGNSPGSPVTSGPCRPTFGWSSMKSTTASRIWVRSFCNEAWFSELSSQMCSHTDIEVMPTSPRVALSGPNTIPSGDPPRRSVSTGYPRSSSMRFFSAPTVSSEAHRSRSAGPRVSLCLRWNLVRCGYISDSSASGSVRTLTTMLAAAMVVLYTREWWGER
mmetsp:Transcript_8699/g.32558  ORF Transcript_8699/g.32558 Transcript_8699/m.32558 type:complete len:258 (-) Transcript_8699:40-813(-)